MVGRIAKTESVLTVLFATFDLCVLQSIAKQSPLAACRLHEEAVLQRFLTLETVLFSAQ